MNEVKQLVADIKDGNIKPIYLLMGEEAYYIDKISSFIEDNVLDEADKGFNQAVLYGADITVDDIVANAKRFPMMAERQVVIIKEAQELSRTIEKLSKYAANPQPSTVLVIDYKYKKIDKRKALYKAVKKTGVVFESKKLYEWVADCIDIRNEDNPKFGMFRINNDGSLGDDVSEEYSYGGRKKRSSCGFPGYSDG